MSKKKIITIVSVLAVVLLSASVISYSIANRGNGDKKQISTELTKRGASSATEYLTNIDLIIQNSNQTPVECYNIVEIIPPAGSASALSTYVLNGSFKKYVIDENSTKDPKEVMASDTIRCDVIKVSGSTSLDDEISSNIMGGTATIREILDATDLIYMSSPGYNSYDQNMSEDIYNYLHTYSLGKNKPMILDYVTPSSSAPGTTSYKYSDLARVISNNYLQRTFAWPQTTTAKDFFEGNEEQGSYYITYNTNKQTASGKVLVVTSNENAADTMYQKMLTSEDSVFKAAYYGNTKPDKWEYTIRTPEGLSQEDLSTQYDFILLEHDIMDQSVSTDIYNTLKMLSESSRYIFYDNRTTTSSEEGSGSISASNNYLKLMQLLLTNKGVSRYSHILAVSNGYFTSLNNAGADGVEGAKHIADIINAGDYRGSGSNGANGKVFRVLELQPCYPIDQELAESRKTPNNDMQYRYGVKGDYYQSPSQVMSNVTKDEVEKGTEFYDFDLSKAKIAYATGLSYNQIQVDQMSTNEFISKKDVVLETYDLVYIGGDTSALVPSENKALVGDTLNQESTKKALAALTSFDMFTHTGQFVKLREGTTYNQTMMDKVKRTPGQSTTYPYGKIYINGQPQETIVEYNGNDINNLKYEELKEYVQKGMPVIVEKRVADAFVESKETLEKEGRMKQLALQQIDPDSWMYKALDVIQGVSETGSSVVWGLDTVGNEEVLEDGNADRLYGNTLGSSLTVFTKEINDRISAVMTSSAVRPSLSVTSSPKEYSEGNKNSYNKFDDGFEVKAYAKPALEGGGNRFDISLYIDLDGNGVFSEGSISGTGECAQTQSYNYVAPGEGAEPDTVTLKYTLEDDFYGIISWKVVAKDLDTGLVSSVTGYAYYERDEEVEKKEIEVLQIMPRPADLKSSMETAIKNNTALQTPENDGHSLYLCKECQLNMYRAEYNIYNNGTVGRNTIGTKREFQGVNLGKHEHKFGIVKFDSVTQNEDWESNLADVLIGEDGDYTVDMDIMYADEFEALVAQIQGQTEEEIEANKILMQQAYGEIEEAESDPAYIAAEEALKEACIDLGSSGKTMANQFKQFAEDREYYKVWYYNIQGSNVGSDAVLTDYRTLYNNYIQYHDRVLEAKEKYREYRRLAYAKDKWMAANYSLVVLGWAEDFGGEDMNEDACAMISDYINRGGSMLNTHDSTTKFEKAGAMNITSNLRQAFGMDRFHVTGAAGAGGGGDAATAAEMTATLQIASTPYTEAKEEEVDATYRVWVTTKGTRGNDTLWDGGTFKVEKGKPQSVVVTANYNSWKDGEWAQRGTGCTFNQTDSTTGKTTIEATINYYEGWNSNSHPVEDGTAVIVYRKVVTTDQWGNTSTSWEQVGSSSKTSGGKVTITLDPAKAITEPAKMTKDFSDGTKLVMKDTDQSVQVTLVDAESSDSNAMTVSTVGTAYDDLTKMLTVTVQVSLPAGAAESCLSGIKVDLIHNATPYSANTDATGKATFTIKQVSTLDGYSISSDSLRYRHFVTEDAALYFFTERAVTEDYVQWNKDMLATGYNVPNLADVWKGFGYNSPVGLTDSYIMNTTNQNANPYKYVEYIEKQIQWDMGYDLKPDNYGPNGASQVNKGIVTTYPFYISSELRIAKTHAQTFALDMEDKDVAVWYTLSAGTDTTKIGASYYAATPHDGMNNYYLYSKGNVFYCGSGHSVVTGPGRDNNDERRLFINVIVNSVRNANMKPKISVHRKDTEGAEVTEDKNEKLNVDNNGNYYYNVDDSEETPEFDFKVRVDSKADLGEVYVFYDLDYGLDTEDGKTNYSNAYEDNANHVLIAEYNTKSENSQVLVSKQLAELRKYTEDPESGYKKLQLKPEYFEVYGGNYTYIVIQATDTNGKTAYQRIKINLIPKLWDLTMVEPASDRVLLDASDRIKYSI